jgi:HEAT repeat protein
MDAIVKPSSNPRKDCPSFALDMEIFWDQITDAVQQQDWAVLNRYLETLLDLPPAPVSESACEPESARSLDLALRVLQTGDFQARWDVSKLLPGLGTAAIAPLIDLLHTETTDPEGRWFAARILGSLGQSSSDASAIAALIKTVQTTDDDDLGRMAAEALANLGSEAIAALTQLLALTETRKLAAQALAHIRRSDTIDPLLSVVQDSDPALRTLAIEALSSFHDQRIPPLLAAALTDPVATVRQAAIAGLAVRSDWVEPLDLVEKLRDRLMDLNLKVCQQAALALGRLGTEAAVAALLQCLQSPHTPVPLQLEIVRSLAWSESAASLQALQQALILTDSADPPAVCSEIIKLLGRWATPNLQPAAATTLITALSHTPDRETQQTIALALGQLGQPEAIDPLIHLLAEPDPRSRLHTIAALKSLNSDQVYEKLQHLAARSDLPEGLRVGVAIALAEW